MARGFTKCPSEPTALMFHAQTTVLQLRWVAVVGSCCRVLDVCLPQMTPTGHALLCRVVAGKFWVYAHLETLFPTSCSVWGITEVSSVLWVACYAYILLVPHSLGNQDLGVSTTMHHCLSFKNACWDGADISIAPCCKHYVDKVLKYSSEAWAGHQAAVPVCSAMYVSSLGHKWNLSSNQSP